MRALIDACLIVRDEAVRLPGCLDSLTRLKPLLSSVRVYDTGSIDATTDIARSYDCEVVQGYWDDDFARARNASLSMCRSEWALVIDADEKVVVDVRALEKILENSSGVDVLNASFIHEDSQGHPIGRSTYAKVVRPATVEFAGRVHEVLQRRDQGPVVEGSIPQDVLLFRHSGYSTPEVRHGKAVRNELISARDVVDATESRDPTRLAEASYHHGRALAALGRNEEALAAFEVAHRSFSERSIGRERTVDVLHELFVCSGQTDRAVRLVRDHVRAGGSMPHARLLTAKLAVRLGHLSAALAALEGIPDVGDEQHEVDPREVLRLKSSALDGLGRETEALACCLVALTRWRDLTRVRECVLRIGHLHAEEVGRLLLDACETEPGGGRTLQLLGDELRRQGAAGAAVADVLSRR